MENRKVVCPYCNTKINYDDLTGSGRLDILFQLIAKGLAFEKKLTDFIYSTYDNAGV